ncbi:MAG TPA: hypothetical protein VF062_15415 [Candidatus Limnocylindrales bacterium]
MSNEPTDDRPALVTMMRPAEAAAYRQLVEDLQAAVGQYEQAVPTAVLRLILGSYERRRNAAPTDAAPTYPCGAPATAMIQAYQAVEGRRRRNYELYGCEAHLADAEAAAVAAGMAAFRAPGITPPASRRCGQVWDYATQSLREVTR